MSKTAIDWIFGITFVVLFFTAQWYVSTVPQHRVITMTQAELDRLIAQERIDAAKQVMQAQRCDRLQDQFRPVPKHGLM